MFTVLHVESSHFFTKLYRRIVEGQKARYLEAGSADEALQILEKEHVDIIISACTVDGGLDSFVKRLGQSRFRILPVVVSSATDTAEERTRMFALGVVDYIVKEDSDEHLARFIEKMVQADSRMDALKSLSIAVLDDSETVHEVMRRTFAIYGIVSMKSYYSAQEILAAPDHDIYLVDINLPDMSGTQIVLEVRKRAPDAVIIAVSAIDHYKVISNTLIAGADDYIIKPFNAMILMARLQASARMLLLYRELEEKSCRLEELVVRDSLTGLFNHKHIIDRLAEEVEKATRYHHKLSVVMFDIDHFKAVNDTWGHQIGDQVLVEFARLLMETARNCDIVGRYGGEEFFVILPETDLDAAMVFGNRLRERLEETRFPGMPELVVTVSGGAAEWKGGGHLMLVKQADHLLYRAKENGRNRIESKASG
ncbi:MAG TPA: diguanylate cyclase [Spirochaetota bacterium]|nr:diguanylate cyclase [Spirochaetota bacterium]